MPPIDGMKRIILLLALGILLMECAPKSYPAAEFISEYEKRALQRENRGDFQISSILLRNDYMNAASLSAGFAVDSTQKEDGLRFRVLFREKKEDAVGAENSEKTRLVNWVKSMRKENVDSAFWITLKSGNKVVAAASQFSLIPNLGNSVGFTVGFPNDIGIDDAQSIEIKEMGLNLGTIRFEVVNPRDVHLKVGA